MNLLRPKQVVQALRDGTFPDRERLHLLIVFGIALGIPWSFAPDDMPASLQTADYVISILLAPTGLAWCFYRFRGTTKRLFLDHVFCLAIPVLGTILLPLYVLPAFILDMFLQDRPTYWAITVPLQWFALIAAFLRLGQLLAESSREAPSSKAGKAGGEW